MRIVSVARRSAVKAKTQTINQIRAMLVSAPQDVREKLWRIKATDCAKACAVVRSLGDTAVLRALSTTLKSLAKRWLALTEELKDYDKQLETLTQKHAQQLRSRFCSCPR
ncbi:hypothetical protein SAMN04487869_14011 [Marinobacter sp. DSM 26671]|nr:hypothetical protein SAMN04487869_14011 [Marinobacter sp. DSM 26671]